MVVMLRHFLRRVPGDGLQNRKGKHGLEERIEGVAEAVHDEVSALDFDFSGLHRAPEGPEKEETVQGVITVDPGKNEVLGGLVGRHGVPFLENGYDAGKEQHGTDGVRLRASYGLVDLHGLANLYEAFPVDVFPLEGAEFPGPHSGHGEHHENRSVLHVAPYGKETVQGLGEKCFEFRPGENVALLGVPAERLHLADGIEGNDALPFGLAQDEAKRPQDVFAGLVRSLDGDDPVFNLHGVDLG